jgi:Iap family predicted aminopeptidase
MQGPTYEGGVGFYVGTWRWWAGELGLFRRYPHAYMAPARVQMTVAEYGLTRHRGYWGCNR